ncbi:hypothetical protein AIOL_003194 [Candidatus Rhodobacter oscarellae]|uniref:Secreted protein n=1 Tax=Candidatus Rhodobacter oscarellae TaxID=1675527 RepID=A0A0J9GXL4_9RHOB|nr:hypothetical protein [Candidatus Rhodobacter lobularis]KMW58223.1 hypothetical protein AIOL_003194 [Candidatus Rhodobacter lobularis]
MIRLILLVAVLASDVSAQQLQVPGLTPDGTPDAMPACAPLPYPDQQNCTRVLACVGDDGLWFDGQARGWDEGPVFGRRNDGVACVGKWSSRGLFGTGFSNLECKDGTTAQVLYTIQDNDTGTVIGHGKDSAGRQIQVWTGLNVLEFLRSDLTGAPELPCTQGAIPIS